MNRESSLDQMRVVGSPRAPGPEYHFDYDPTEGDTFELQMLGDHIDSDGENEEPSGC